MKFASKSFAYVALAALAFAGVAVFVACAEAGVTSTTNEVSPESESDGSATKPDAALTIDAPSTIDASSAEAASDETTCETPCGIAPQCGCKKSETCDSDDTGARSCVSAGTATVGIACLSTRECAEGLVCANGVCRVPCPTVGVACTGNRTGTCSEYPKSTKDGGASPLTYAACAVTCAYDKEDSCGFKPGDLLASACVYQAATDTVECQKVRNVQLQGGLCTADAECGAGRICNAGGAGFSACRRLCKVGDSNACGGCTGVTPPRIVDGVTYGACP